jgi:hypothetical protein
MPVLHGLSRSAHPTPFHHLLTGISRSKAIANAKLIQQERQIAKLDSLSIQSGLLKALREFLPRSEFSGWSEHLLLVTSRISNFARKALVRCLPTNSNLHRWDRAKSSACPNCGELETENHILNNCSVAAVQGRYTWRHNAVLRLLLSFILPHVSPHATVYADLPGHTSPAELFTDILPDITVVRGSEALILELTCCYEKNFSASGAAKIRKYADPSKSSKVQLTFHVHTLEVSSLGFVSCASLRKFMFGIGAPPLQAGSVRKLGEMALRSSFYIFCCRHKTWPVGVSDSHFL